MTESPPTKASSTYDELESKLHGLPWILQGSVMQVAPRSTSPKAKTTYIWTRKIRGKTVTVALSKEQYRVVRKAIEANRRLEATLKKMRALSEQILLDSSPGVPKRPRSKPFKNTK